MKRVEGLFLTFSAVGSIIILILLIPMVLAPLMTNPSQLAEAITDPEILGALYVTFSAATMATLIALVFGVPLAYVMARREFAFKGILESILNIPLTIPHSVAGILVLLAYHSRTQIGSLLSNLGIVVEDTIWGITLAMLFVSSPILISSAKAGFSMIDENLEYVARTLGANHYKTFFTVTLPLALRAIASGAILTWTRSVSEVGALLIVAPYPRSIALLVIQRFEAFGLSSALPITVILLGISLVIVLITTRILRR
ncbi:MAG: molybdenum ABC transporter permease [Candidatus Wolframiiraptor sp.]|nr:MAG: molybdenum ABC transporter permease [Candidatus Wolframiiraptor sp.]